MTIDHDDLWDSKKGVGKRELYTRAAVAAVADPDCFRDVNES
jgi:hypothetical protein